MAHPGQSLEAVANEQLDGWTGEWCGDVWKTPALLRSTRKDLEVFVLDTDYGCGVVTRGQNTAQLQMTPAEIHALEYSDLAAQRRTHSQSQARKTGFTAGSPDNLLNPH